MSRALEQSDVRVVADDSADSGDDAGEQAAGDGNRVVARDGDGSGGGADGGSGGTGSVATERAGAFAFSSGSGPRR